ncbi:MAG: ATP-binding protein [Desulfobacterales bacterium]|jgi:predicted ATPase
MRPTRWTVITGAPCSGKTTVIRRLEQKGFRVVHEVARAIIDGQMARGLSLEQIKSDPDRFERGILERKLAIESDLPEDEEIFFDRGIPDSIAYFQIEGLDPAAPTAASRIRRYRRVWFFERLSCEPDRARTEDDALAARIEGLLLASYRRAGYGVTRSPVCPVAERVERILKIR